MDVRARAPSLRDHPRIRSTVPHLAANQGLYNGFLAAGLVWGLIASDPTGFAAKVFFLGCIAVAGLYGALTASRRILFVQTVPALVTLALVLLAR